MTLSRIHVLAVLSFALSAGCRSGGIGNLAPATPLVPSRVSERPSELLSTHNRNAEQVQSFEAKPSISIALNNRSQPRVDGHLYMERPDNFKLELKSVSMGDVADIGSNDDEFWFWARQFDKKGEKVLYYGKQEDVASNPQAGTFQPDWIVEAMGLRVIPEDEIDQMKVKRGVEPGTLVLSHCATASSGVSFSREIVIWESNHRVKEIRIFSADQRALAQAVVIGGPNAYQEIPRTKDASAGDMVYIPNRLKLDWYQEKVSFDVTLSGPRANTKFTPERRQAVFVEPERKDYVRRNIAELSGTSRAPTTVRETRPAPRPRVRLSEPAPISDDGARALPGDPAALSGDLPAPRASASDLIGPRIPTAPDPEFLKATGSGWRGARVPIVSEQ